MPATTVVTLDTTAPQVVFGDVIQGGDGSLQVEYVIDELPYSIEAELILGDVTLPMAVLADRFFVNLPPEYSTAAFIRVTTTDEVFNEETFSMPLLLAGKSASLALVFEQSPYLGYEVEQDPLLVLRVEDHPELASEADQGVTLHAEEDPDLSTGVER